MKNNLNLEFNPFFNTPYTLKYLDIKYQSLNIKNVDQWTYKNCNSLIYYLEHGLSYFKDAQNSSFSVQPVLIFYGYIQLLKACLLTVDPEYPKTTTVLAHGVSSRKKKKQNYEFIYDEVKLQSNGLFSHFNKKLYNIHYFTQDKFKMIDLFSRIPELSSLISKLGHQNYLTPVENDRHSLFINRKLLSDLKTSENRIFHLLPSQYLINNEIEYINNNFKISFSRPLNSPVLVNQLHPIYFNYKENQWCMINDVKLLCVLPEMAIHYLILYNLSMICRYETEWWMDLLHSYSTSDYSFIKEYINLSIEKIPFLVRSYLE